ncbi:MAG TPA: TetR/AcrR family transcriptional regulator C-terminal domain-containing protein [Actinocrinis sp.]|jgi:AcrR family transcriptional regulator|uniref:TetR/AcrR family transcriptional regulator n=1 Tax=Actinocrinis sp. TaxID=1920516 RepID=UPI002DDCBD1C|nr:TetR/AcrR family transcriptional regulator C-terminal domain-containing protein [Actinocrinis sp.]HEV3172077.1 TetR/AcrR family transcriptional regulator C-terminal domain-containing protein [Actinocrinis sp.]
MARPSLGEDSLSLDVIARAALRIIDSEGSDALNFRRLGKELGVAHMTVYRRLADLKVPLDGCVLDYLADSIPQLDPQASWADATEARFTALYEIIVAHPGIVAMRRGGPWLGPRVMQKLIEPQLAANLAAGMTPDQMVRAYRRMYLFTLGCACFTDHATPEAVVSRTRAALAALPPERFPAATENVEAILKGVVDHEVFYGGLRHLIRAADPGLGN